LTNSSRSSFAADAPKTAIDTLASIWVKSIHWRDETAEPV
jgi:hypothetical protein